MKRDVSSRVVWSGFFKTVCPATRIQILYSRSSDIAKSAIGDRYHGWMKSGLRPWIIHLVLRTLDSFRPLQGVQDTWNETMDAQCGFARARTRRPCHGEVTLPKSENAPLCTYLRKELILEVAPRATRRFFDLSRSISLDHLQVATVSTILS